MNRSVKKMNVGILIFDDAEVLDFCGPFEVFSVTSQLHNYEFFDVFTVGKTNAPISAVNGLSVNPTYAFSDHPSIDILIISGGQGTRKVMHDDETITWLLKTYHKSQLTLCICSGSRLLGKAGLLNEKEFCTHHDVYDHMKEIVAIASPRKDLRFVKSDDKIYTSGGISAGIDLSFHIIENLLGEGIKEQTAKYMEYAI